MQRFLTSTFLSATAIMLAGVGYAQTPASSTPAATTQSAPAATTPKAATTAKKPGTAAPAPLTTEKQKFSYALGMSFGSGNAQMLKKLGIEFDPALVAQGVKDSMSGAKTRLTEDQAKAVLTDTQAKVKKQQEEKEKAEAAKNKAAGDAYLAANKSKQGVVTLPSGLQYKILTAGTGPKPTTADSVVCNYRGTLIDGTEFDSSYKRGKPATFGVSQVIKGWTEALQLMPVGSKWQLYIPPDLAYGERGEPRGGIGPNSTLVFDVELMSIVDKNKTEKPADKPEEKK